LHFGADFEGESWHQMRVFLGVPKRLAQKVKSKADFGKEQGNTCGHFLKQRVKIEPGLSKSFQFSLNRKQSACKKNILKNKNNNDYYY
jgi:hypothetical protein